MKKLLLASVFVVPGMAGAADLKVPYKAPEPAPYVSYDAFSGFYLGAHIGYGLNEGGGQAISEVPLAGANVEVPRGVVGGVHAGYGQRFANLFYVGLEGDADISAINAGGNGLITASSKNNWIADVRARLGIIPVGHAMIYGTGGWAWSGGSFSLTEGNLGTTSTSPTMSGFVWGGGLEVPFSQNWLGRIEYLRYDFGSATVVGNVATFTVNDRVEVVRAGVSYKF